ncbi:cation:proton antiporter [Achromobacter aegrifaciens]
MSWTQTAVEFFTQLAPFTRFLLWMLLFLLVPLLCERVRIPGVIGFLIAGLLLGPAGIGLLQPDTPLTQLISELGVALLLFFIGYDIDFSQLRQAKAQVLWFGLLTFGLPLAMGYAIARSCGYTINASLLIGSLIASHTLLAYPVAARLGLGQRLSVMATSGATVFTDIAAMLVLAVCLVTHRRGFSVAAMDMQMLQVAIFIPLVIFGGRWALSWLLARMRRDESRLMILFLAVACATQAAELFGLDGIVGAFLAGIAARQATPHPSNAGVLKVLSDTFLIPAFFMATGMLLHPIEALRTFVEQPLLAFGLLAALMLAKLLAAIGVGLPFRYSRNEIGLVWSLTLPQVAATLAAATVAYKTVNSAGQPLIDLPVLNVILMLVVLTSLGAPLLTQRFADRMTGSQARPDPGGPDPAGGVAQAD